MMNSLRMLSLAVAIASATPNAVRADAFDALGGALFRAAVIREMTTVSRSGPQIAEINFDGGMQMTATRVVTYSDPKRVIVVGSVRDQNKKVVAMVELDLYDGEFISFRPLTPDSASWTHMGNSTATTGSSDAAGGDSM